MQYKVPKNVGIDDKIFFFLTLKQLIICAFGSTLCYVLYLAFKDLGFVTWFMPSFVIMLFTVLFAFFRFNEMSFVRLVLRLFELNFKPTRRYFYNYSNNITPLNTLSALYPPVQKQKAVTETNFADRYETDLDSLSDLLDFEK